MSLKTCPDCGHSVSHLAPACPGCGRPMIPAASKAMPAGVWYPPDHKPAAPARGPARITVNRSQAAARPLPTAPFKVQTESTAKPLKAKLAIWTILLMIGAFLTIFSGYEGGPQGYSTFVAGVILAAIALPAFIATKIRIWWHHG
jgi:hypothetical protein